jgi:hypothetical protein
MKTYRQHKTESKLANAAQQDAHAKALGGLDRPLNHAETFASISQVFARLERCCRTTTLSQQRQQLCGSSPARDTHDDHNGAQLIPSYVQEAVVRLGGRAMCAAMGWRQARSGMARPKT